MLSHWIYRDLIGTHPQLYDYFKYVCISLISEYVSLSNSSANLLLGLKGQGASIIIPAL
jgi:hypothetical protein